MPKRIQMSHQRPWRSENPDAVIVARPNRFGSPIRIVGKRVVLNGLDLFVGNPGTTDAELAAFTVRAFRWQIINHPNVVGITVDEIRAELAGRDLACWCPVEDGDGNRVPCHADVLLELANA